MKRIYFNLALSIAVMFGVSSFVFADDRHYAPPAKLECKGTLPCDYDNTFIKLMSGPTKLLPGTYQFSKASASSYRSYYNITDDFRIVYEYVNQQDGVTAIHGEVAYSTVQPDVKAPGSQWKEVSANNWVCNSKNPNACGFTHTPWRADLKPQLQGNNKIESHAATLLKASSPYQSGAIIVHNNSPYPLVVGYGDFNTAGLSPRVVAPIIVPAKTVQKVANYIMWENSSVLMLTLTLGSDNLEGRNVDNTAVFQSSHVYNDSLVVDNRRFNVWLDYDVDIDLGSRKSALNWVISIN